MLAMGASIPSFAAYYSLIGDVGINLFSLPKMLENDTEAALNMLRELGYKNIEFFGPYTFSTEAAKAKWAVTTKAVVFSGSGFFSMRTGDMRLQPY